MGRTPQGKMELKLATEMAIKMEYEMDMDPKMVQLQIQEGEGVPIAYTHRKTFRDGSSLYVVPPKTKEEKYDLVIITPDKSTFHFNRNRAYLPRDIAVRFFSGIQNENDFDFAFKEYWDTINKFQQD